MNVVISGLQVLHEAEVISGERVCSGQMITCTPLCLVTTHPVSGNHLAVQLSALLGAEVCWSRES